MKTTLKDLMQKPLEWNPYLGAWIDAQGNIYELKDNDPTTDLPKNLLVATGNILGDTTGHKTESITPTVLQPGWNWLAYTANNGTMQCRGLTGAQPLIASPNPGGYVGGNPRASYVWNYITGGSTTSPPSGPSNRVGLGVYNTAPFIQVRCQP